MERGRRSEPKGRRRVESEPRDVESERRMFEGDNFERAPNDRGRNAAGERGERRIDPDDEEARGLDEQKMTAELSPDDLE